MGKATAQRRPTVPTPTGEDATPERRAQSDTKVVEALRSSARERMGKARKIVPPIETLHEAGKLTDDEYKALAYYADQATLAERSPLKDSLNRERAGGTGDMYSATVVSAMLETARIERDLGALRDIAHAVAVNEMTLAKWCIERHGGRERYGPCGKFIAIVPQREKANMAIALLELRMASHRIVR